MSWFRTRRDTGDCVSGYTCEDPGTAHPGICIAYFAWMMTATAFLLVVSFSGCVLPAEVENYPDDNLPPRAEAFNPWPPGGIVRQSKHESCPPKTYHVALSDPDLDDTLTWRTFINYHKDRQQESTTRTVTNDPAGVPISFTVSADDARFEGLEGVPHLIELLVADRPFTEDDRTPGHTTEPGGQMDSIVWTVVLTQDPECE